MTNEHKKLPAMSQPQEWRDEFVVPRKRQRPSETNSHLFSELKRCCLERRYQSLATATGFPISSSGATGAPPTSGLKQNRKAFVSILKDFQPVAEAGKAKLEIGPIALRYSLELAHDAKVV